MRRLGIFWIIIITAQFLAWCIKIIFSFFVRFPIWILGILLAVAFYSVLGVSALLIVGIFGLVYAFRQISSLNLSSLNTKSKNRSTKFRNSISSVKDPSLLPAKNQSPIEIDSLMNHHNENPIRRKLDI